MEAGNGKHTVFFSWNSHNSENSKLRRFIEDSIKLAQCDLTLCDGSSSDMTTFEKIKNAAVFIADMTEMNRKSNVIYELGYAITQIGYDRIITVTTTEGDPGSDASMHEPYRVSLEKNEHVKKHVNDLSEKIKNCFRSRGNPINLFYRSTLHRCKSITDRKEMEIIDRYKYPQGLPLETSLINEIHKAKTSEEIKECLSKIREYLLEKIKEEDKKFWEYIEEEKQEYLRRERISKNVEYWESLKPMILATSIFDHEFGFNGAGYVDKRITNLKVQLLIQIGINPQNDFAIKIFQILLKQIELT